MSKRDFFQLFCMFYLRLINRKCAKEKKHQYLTLYQNWNRTPVYFELAVSASYVCMCQIKMCREIVGYFCDFGVYFCDFVGYFCDLALTSVKRNSVLQLSVSTVSWVTISEEERGIGENDLESAVKEINTLQSLSSSPWLQMRLFLKIIEILQIDAPRQ